MTMRFKSVKALVALLQNTSDPTTVAIMEYFQPYCDCSITLWLIEEINNGNVDVINKIRELIENEDPTPFTRELIYPGYNFLLRTYCQGADLYGVYANGNGTNNNSLIVLSSNKCADYFIKDSLTGLSGEAYNKIPEIGSDYNYNNYGRTAEITPYGVFYPDYAEYDSGYMEGHQQYHSVHNTTKITTTNVEAGLTQVIHLKDGSLDQPHWGDGTEFDIMLEVDPTISVPSHWDDQILSVGILSFTVKNVDGTTRYEAMLSLFTAYDDLKIGTEIDQYTNDYYRNNWGHPEIDLDAYEAQMTQAQKNECNDVFINGSRVPYFFTRRSYNEGGNFIGYELRLKLTVENNKLIVYVNDIEVYNSTYISNAVITSDGLRAGYAFNRFFHGSDFNGVNRTVDDFWPDDYIPAKKQFVKDFYVKPI